MHALQAHVLSCTFIKELTRNKFRVIGSATLQSIKTTFIIRFYNPLLNRRFTVQAYGQINSKYDIYYELYPVQEQSDSDTTTNSGITILFLCRKRQVHQGAQEARQLRVQHQDQLMQPAKGGQGQRGDHEDSHPGRIQDPKAAAALRQPWRALHPRSRTYAL